MSPESENRIIEVLNQRLDALDRDTNTRFEALNRRLESTEKVLRWVATKEDLRALSLSLATAAQSDHAVTHAAHMADYHKAEPPRRVDDPEEIDMRPMRSPDIFNEMSFFYRVLRWVIIATASSAITLGVLELWKG